MSLPQRVPGGQSRLAAAVRLQNQRPVPAGVHHDVDDPIPVVAVLRWATGTERAETVALEWTRTLVRVRVNDLRVMTGAVWLPARDVRRRPVRPAQQDQARGAANRGAAADSSP
jgi:hypothetical protein